MGIYEPLTIFDDATGPSLVLDRNRYLVDACRDKSVLHVGCTDAPMTREKIAAGTLLHASLEKAARSVLGIDISEEALAILVEAGLRSVAKMDAEKLELQERYDVVLAGDVLEHMNNPGLFLERVTGVLARDGELIIAVPHAFTVNAVSFWLKGRENTHRDHTFFFSPKTLAELCRRYGLLPVKLVYVVQPRSPHESELFVRLRELVLRACNRPAPAFAMHFRAEGSVDRSRSYLYA
jgi:2-polyprenyl-3-methyl-5-hydroxy-6-metoxy-1,4-benzoquinol methylase